MELLYKTIVGFIASVIPGIVLFSYRHYHQELVWARTSEFTNKTTTLYITACYGVHTWLSWPQAPWFNIHVISGAIFAIGLLLLKFRFKGSMATKYYSRKGFAHSIVGAFVILAGIAICWTGNNTIPRLHSSFQLIMKAELYGVVTLLFGTVFFSVVYQSRLLHVVCARGLVCACAISLPVGLAQRLVQALGYHYIAVKCCGYFVAFAGTIIWLVMDFFMQKRRVGKICSKASVKHNENEQMAATWVNNECRKNEVNRLNECSYDEIIKKEEYSNSKSQRTAHQKICRLRSNE